MSSRLIISDINRIIENPSSEAQELQGKWFFTPGDFIPASQMYPNQSAVAVRPEIVPKEEPMSLDDAVKEVDETFSQMLVRKIDELGMRDADCYKKAHVDRKLFSKIRSNVDYRPSKITAISFAIALELPISEAKELLQKAGYALSKSNKFDLVITFFINRQNYNFFDINEALLSLEQPLLF